MKKEKNKRLKLLLLIAAVFVIMTSCGSGNPDSQNSPSQNEDAGKKETKEVKSEKPGTWLKTQKKAQADGKKHDITFRVTKIATDEKTVKKEIDAYNVSGTNETIDQDIGSDNLGYCVAYYEVKFPDSYPDQDYGLTNVTMDFTIVAPDGSEEIRHEGTVYPNLTDTIQIGSIPQGYDFYAGQTYKGKIVYAMAKGCTDYRLKVAGYYISPTK